MQTIGTCSICGGAVCVPTAWGGILPPTPICQSCGATPKAPHGPVIDMEKPMRQPLGIRINPDGTNEPLWSAIGSNKADMPSGNH